MKSQLRATVSNEKRGQKLLTFGLFCIALWLLLLVGKLVFNRSQPIAFDLMRAKEIARELGGDTGAVPIIAFVTGWCPACRAAERYFNEEKIAYIRADIEESELARQYFEELSHETGLGIPQIIVGTQVLVGFDREIFEKTRQGLIEQLSPGVRG